MWGGITAWRFAAITEGSQCAAEGSAVHVIESGREEGRVRIGTALEEEGALVFPALRPRIAGLTDKIKISSSNRGGTMMDKRSRRRREVTVREVISWMGTSGATSGRRVERRTMLGDSLENDVIGRNLQLLALGPARTAATITMQT